MPTLPQGETVPNYVNILPAAYADAILTLPDHAYHVIERISLTLATDATAAARRVSIRYDHAAAEFTRYTTNIDQPANTTYIYSFMPAINDATAAVNSYWHGPLPYPMLLRGGTLIRAQCWNMQAGDQFNMKVLYRPYIIPSD
jgi:hypothetical protein